MDSNVFRESHSQNLLHKKSNQQYDSQEKPGSLLADSNVLSGSLGMKSPRRVSFTEEKSQVCDRPQIGRGC